MARKPSIAIVGSGRLGTALTLALADAGYAVCEIASRNSPTSRRHAVSLARRVGAKPVTLFTEMFTAEIVWLCVPDRQIGPVARKLARSGNWSGKTCFHSSGALNSEELSSLRAQGASVASVHPLMTFIADSSTPLAGVPFALEGDPRALRVARGIVKSLGGESFTIASAGKPAYHAFGAFVSPLVVSLLATAEAVGLAAGLDRKSVRRRLAPIVQQTLNNYLAKGPAQAFTGPLVRGDVDTVASHLRAMRRIPDANEVYAALARAALRRLPVNRKKELNQLFAEGK